MSLEVFSCPECGVTLKNALGLTPGSRVKCPKCRFEFALPEPDSASPPSGWPPAKPGEEVSDWPRRRSPAESSASESEHAELPLPPRSKPVRWEEEDDRPSRWEDEDRPYRRYSEDPLEGLSSDYVIDLGEWFSYAKAHYSAVLGPMIGFIMINFVISVVLGFIPCGNFISIFVEPPLRAGFTIVALYQLTGKSWTFGDFFSGFQWYGALLGNYLFSGLLAGACLMPGIIAVIVAAIAQDETLLIAAVCLAVLNILPVIYVMLRISLFSTALIIDRNCGPVEAMQGSWRLTAGHFWGLLGVLLLLVLINLGGFLLLCVGLLFTMSLSYLVLAAGYLLVAGRKKPLMPSQQSWEG